MASHRSTRHDEQAEKPPTDELPPPPRREKRTSMAKRGLRSLSLALVIPLTLTLISINLGSFLRTTPHPVLWLWTLHFGSFSSTFLMGLAGWMVWADGGFHRPQGFGLWVYLGQTVLGLLWEPIVLGLGAKWIGLMVNVSMIGALGSCCRTFGMVNPIAGDLVKFCLGWAAFLVFANLKLLS